jgi:DUF1680 family protein
MPSIPGYIYAKKDKDLYVNLYIGSETTFELDEKNKISLKQSSNMPWEGKVNLEIGTNNKKGSTFALKLRIPGWANGNIFPTDLYEVREITEMGNIFKINGEAYEMRNFKDGYFTLERTWKNGDKVEINFPMEAQQVYSNSKITTNKNLIAIQNGPLMYCAEYVDNDGKTSNILLNKENSFTKKFEPNLLNGVLTLSTTGKAINFSDNEIQTLTKPIKLIPYFARSNRGSGEMRVWFPTKISNVKIEN